MVKITSYNSPIKQIIKIVAGIMVGLVVLNFPYLFKQLTYTITPHTPDTIASKELPAQNNPANKMEPNTLIIASLGIRAPIIYVGENNEALFQKALAYGVVHHPHTAAVGQPGNAYIFGHSSDFLWAKGDYKTIFALLPKIRLGESIIVSDPAGNQFNYTVIDKKIVSPKDLRPLDQQEYKRKLLTLQTSYPLGTALKRYLVIAELK